VEREVHGLVLHRHLDADGAEVVGSQLEGDFVPAVAPPVQRDDSRHDLVRHRLRGGRRRRVRRGGDGLGGTGGRGADGGRGGGLQLAEGARRPAGGAGRRLGGGGGGGRGGGGGEGGRRTGVDGGGRVHDRGQGQSRMGRRGEPRAEPAGLVDEGGDRGLQGSREGLGVGRPVLRSAGRLAGRGCADAHRGGRRRRRHPGQQGQERG